MENLERDLEEMRDYFKSGKTIEKTWRISQLKGLRQFLNHKEEEIYSVLNQDLGKHHVEAFRDEVFFFFFLIISFLLKNLIFFSFFFYLKNPT